jgi:hypothetical protein
MCQYNVPVRALGICECTQSPPQSLMNQGVTHDARQVHFKQFNDAQDNSVFEKELPLVGLEPTALCLQGKVL